MKKNNKGFTLIELMTTVAIISLLVAVILVSLSNSRDSAKDARVLTSLEQIRSAGQIYYSLNNTYTGFDSDEYLVFLNEDISNLLGTAPVMAVASDGSGYCFYAALFNNSFCCVDSDLTYKCFDTDAILSTTCLDGSNYQCE